MTYGYGYGSQQQPEPRHPTPGGRWIKRDVDIHRCAKPPYSGEVKRGDIWECGTCREQWIVTKIDGDQRDGSSWLVWEKHNTNSNGIYAPGTK